MIFKLRLKRIFTLALAGMMLLTAAPVNLLAGTGGATQSEKAYEIVFDDKTVVRKEDYLNDATKLEVKPAKLEGRQTAEEFIENPAQPNIYTLRTDFKVQRGEKYEINYQPYIASVGEAASQEEKDKANKTIKLPTLDGYGEPQANFTINYKTIFDAAQGKNKTGDIANGFKYSDKQEFKYKAKSNSIKIKHVFQNLEDFTKYENPDGSTDDTSALITIEKGNTGSTMEVNPFDKKDPRRKGFVPEADYITMQVPENVKNFILEYRYNRAYYDVIFDTEGGTEIPARTLYYEQEIPKIDDNSIPIKEGCKLIGWKPSHDLVGANGTTYRKDEIIRDASNNAIVDLGNSYYAENEQRKLVLKKASDNIKLTMPALKLEDDTSPREKLTFTAVWKENEKADYAIQFWAEKADHADGATLSQKYEYIGSKVYGQQKTGSRPDLDNEPVKDIVFPDLDQARLDKIWAGDKFKGVGGQYLYLNKFFVYNKDLTHKQNKDPKDANQVKSVDATGRTVYNIYYDRQEYELYFTISNYKEYYETFFPEIWGFDQNNNYVKLGGPGNLYHYKARFNQLMDKWPNEATQVKGFDEDKQSFGWLPNYSFPSFNFFLDAPPYRLNAEQFLDVENYDTVNGYVGTIDNGDGTVTNAKDFRTLSFGIYQEPNCQPKHYDFWMDGFEPGKVIIDYDFYNMRGDTRSSTYEWTSPKILGFTPKEPKYGSITYLEDELENENRKRQAITPYPNEEVINPCETDAAGNFTRSPKGWMNFILYYFSDTDENGELKKDSQQYFIENDYIRFEYYRNKYPLRFYYNPSEIKDDSEFNSTNKLDTFYQYPLHKLNLDNPSVLKSLGLTELYDTDTSNGKPMVKRPTGLSPKMEFKGWALDPAGTKLVWENKDEIMPAHPVNLYAKWGESDYQWKVTFDPDGGNLKDIKEEDLTTERKTIRVGDIGQYREETFARKETNVGDKQVFTVIQGQKLVEPKFKPTKKGYDFMGWEVIRYTKNSQGYYTTNVDNSYREIYKVPELHSFGNEVVSPIYLKAIWVPNNRVDVKVLHYKFDNDYNLVEGPIEDTLADKRANYLVATTGDKQGDEYILAPHDELEEKLTGNLKKEYNEYNGRVKANNTFFQTFRVEPAKKLNPANNIVEDNPDVKNNVFKFFYRQFRKRQYKVNYIDERFRGKTNEAEGAIIAQEKVSNGNRHFDARNYRSIPGWKLVSAPQQQLFFDVDEDTNKFLGINGTGKDEITFYYKDVRVIEVPGTENPPEGYVRVTFKAEKGGSFGKDAQGKDITELHYDVIKGLKSEHLPVPKELAEGKTADKDKHYITAETGKKFTRWDNNPLLNANTIINEAHTFTAYFEWSGLSVDTSGLVCTESFVDPKPIEANPADPTIKAKDWSNRFAPSIEKLKEKLILTKDNTRITNIDEHVLVEFVNEDGDELKTDTDVLTLLDEKGKKDAEEQVRKTNIKALVKFKDEKLKALEKELNTIEESIKKVSEEIKTLRADPVANKDEISNKETELKELETNKTVKSSEIEIYKARLSTQELNIPITVYKNVYEALNSGDKPFYLSEAEKGELKDVTGDYVMVTIKPTPDMNSKGDKIYYVNKNAWVKIKEIDISQDKNNLGFRNWTADKNEQNEDGVFDFNKRHKFTEETTITPVFTDDIVAQTGEDKPKVPENYVKVEFKHGDYGTIDQSQSTIYWVNPTKEVTVNAPKVITNEDYKHIAWTYKLKADDVTDKEVKTLEFVSDTFTEKETTITANYLKKVVTDDPNDKENYAEVTFKADADDQNPARGTLKGTTTYWVLKNTDITLTKPVVTSNEGYTFTEWTPAVKNYYSGDEVYTAQYKEIENYNKEQVSMVVRRPSIGSNQLVITTLQSDVALEILVDNKPQKTGLSTNAIGDAVINLDLTFTSGDQEIKVTGSKDGLLPVTIVVKPR